MTATTDCRLTEPVSLDLLDPDFRANSPTVLAAAARHWYAPTALGPAILRHEDCAAILRDRRFRQPGVDHLTMQGIVDGPLVDFWATMILNVEGADHGRLRRLISGAFTATTVERLRPGMRELVHRLVDSFAPAGECEFMSEFADRYPPTVMFDLLGIPRGEHEQFLAWAKDLILIMTMTVEQDRGRVEAALGAMDEATDRLCAQRREDPGPDLISALVTAVGGTDQLAPHELRSMVAGLVLGGQDSTRLQLGLGMLTFARHPDQWRVLADHPELAGRAVDEVMRVAPSAPVVWRVAAEDITYRDLHIVAGTRIWPMVAAAHRDPGVYGDDAFDISRERPPLLSFGHGVHYCIGAALARAELTEAFRILAARLPGLALAGEPVMRPELSALVGPEQLPIRFDRC